MSTPYDEDRKIVELMYERFPNCPLCRSDAEYEFSGWVDYYAQCKSCGAKWHLWNWLSNEPSMKLVEMSRDTKKDTVAGHDLLGKVYPIDFWQKLKVKRLPVKVKEDEKELEIPEVKEVKEETVQKKPNPLAVLIALFFIILVVAVPIIWWWSITPKATTFTIEIQSNTSWAGSIGAGGSSRSIEGSGSQSFQVSGTIAVAVIQKQTEYGTLTVSILKGGRVLDSQTTTASYGVVSVSASG